jgi:hypothetical protein
MEMVNIWIGEAPQIIWDFPGYQNGSSFGKCPKFNIGFK